MDLKAVSITVTGIDRFGNLVHSKVYLLVTFGRSSSYTEAAVRDVVKEIATQAVAVHKPIVIEKLNFAKKKSEIKGKNPKYARILSSFAHNAIDNGIRTRAFNEGIEVIEVNPV